MYILAVIPARSGSKRIKDKNVYNLCGKPLIDYTIEAALNSIVDDIVISSDSEAYADKRCKFFKRSAELSKDATPMLPVLQDVLETYEMAYRRNVDSICLLQPTSPLRTPEDIDNAIHCLMETNASSLYSGFYMGIKTDEPYDKNKPMHFQRNGAVFLMRKELIQNGKLWSDDVIKFVMPFSRSFDVDTLEEMYICESILKNPKGGQYV
jgi:CMP-N,N'-diacetyllegionaminic acid synthase